MLFSAHTIAILEDSNKTHFTMKLRKICIEFLAVAVSSPLHSSTLSIGRWKTFKSFYRLIKNFDEGSAMLPANSIHHPRRVCVILLLYGHNKVIIKTSVAPNLYCFAQHPNKWQTRNLSRGIIMQIKSRTILKIFYKSAHFSKIKICCTPKICHHSAPLNIV